MEASYLHLGVYSDWVAEAARQGPLFPVAKPGAETQRRVRETLGFTAGPEQPLDVRVERTWERDGVAGELLTWWVGYGPRTEAYLLKPLGAAGPLPGVVALHDHGGFKYFGKEKIADGPEDPDPAVAAFRAVYGGRAYANALAKRGFVVLVHDTFLWGSRKFPLEEMPPDIPATARLLLEHRPPDASTAPEIALYNLASGTHEHLVSKYCNLLGTSMAGVVSHEDRIAVNYLLSRPDILPGGVGCVGLSGGGNRGALLQATHDRLIAAVIVGLMSTYEGLLDHNVYSHTWMLFPFGWSRCGDWADLAACRAPSPLLVQYDRDDPLFTLAGMEAAHRRIAEHYQSVGRPEAYEGQFYPGVHKFDLEMQAAAFDWLEKQMKKGA